MTELVGKGTSPSRHFVTLAKIAYNGLKTGSFHLFMYPKRSSYHSGKTRFSPIFDPFWSPKSPFFKAFWNCGAS